MRDPRPGSATDATLASADTLAGEAPGEVTSPRSGSFFGRFVVLEHLGAGGMGVVVAAHDPDLDRRVALKLLRPEREAVEPGRLLREARAMARLAHPNVLSVHEVGTVGDQVFLAMEYAENGSLRQWCRAHTRTSREILDAFIAAGRGLAAAHEAGLVHRDFKPENVLRMRDGTVKVADFGLAATGATDDVGALVGTPSYMAPEQHRMERVGPPADQFAFCVALWEALSGALPFRGERYEELARSISAGELIEPPAVDPPPEWLREVLRRGMRPDPAQRWASMPALLDALAADPVMARRRRLRAGLVGVSFVGLATIAGYALWCRGGGAPRIEPCQGAAEGLAGVWDGSRRETMRGAFAAAGGDRSTDSYARVAARLDDYAGRWTAARMVACEDTHVRGVQSPAALDLRMRCLDRRLGELDALIDVLAAAPDASLVDRSMEAAARLSGLEECADTETLAQSMPPPEDPALRARVEALRAGVARARALEQAGKYSDGIVAIAAVRTEAESIDYPPLLAETLYQQGRLQKTAGDAAGAEASLMAALSPAAAAHDDVLTTAVWGELLYVIGYMKRETARALELWPIAEAAARRAGGDGEAGASVYNSIGALLLTAGRYQEARPLLERAIELREKALGPEHPDVARGLNNLGTLHEATGEYDTALRYYQRALALKEKLLGPDHPSVANGLNNLGVVLTRTGRLSEARDVLERSLAVWERAMGPDHADVANALTNLGAVLELQGDPTEALRGYRRALAIREKALGPDHPHVALTLTGIVRALVALDQADAAIEPGERALAIRMATAGDAALLADARFALARALWDGGVDRARASTLAEQARADFAAAGVKRSRELAELVAWQAAR